EHAARLNQIQHGGILKLFAEPLKRRGYGRTAYLHDLPSGFDAVDRSGRTRIHAGDERAAFHDAEVDTGMPFTGTSAPRSVRISGIHFLEHVVRDDAKVR